MSEMVLEVVVHTEIVLKQGKSIRELAKSEQSNNGNADYLEEKQFGQCMIRLARHQKERRSKIGPNGSQK